MTTAPAAPPSQTKNFAYPPAATCGYFAGAPHVDINANMVTSKTFAAPPPPPTTTNGGAASANSPYPVTLNSIISSCGLLAPLGDLNFGAHLGAGDGGAAAAPRVRHYSNGGATFADSNSSSTSTNSSSGFGSGGCCSDLSSLGSSFFHANVDLSTHLLKAKRCVSPFPSLCEPTAPSDMLKCANGLQARGELDGAYEPIANGTAKSMLLEEEDGSHMFWDARLKDIADAMTYLELI